MHFRPADLAKLSGGVALHTLDNGLHTCTAGQIRAYDADTVVFYSGWFVALLMLADATPEKSARLPNSTNAVGRGVAPTLASSSGKFAGSFSGGEET